MGTSPALGQVPAFSEKELVELAAAHFLAPGQFNALGYSKTGQLTLGLIACIRQERREKRQLAENCHKAVEQTQSALASKRLLLEEIQTRLRSLADHAEMPPHFGNDLGELAAATDRVSLPVETFDPHFNAQFEALKSRVIAAASGGGTSDNPLYEPNKPT